MSENLPALSADQYPFLPELEQVCDDVPQMSADAELVLPTETYAPWMRSIKSWLEKAGAVNGVDYRASVATAGFQGGKMLFRVKWHTMTDKGVLYLNLMASTLSLLEAETKKLGMDERKPETPEIRQISGENG